MGLIQDDVLYIANVGDSRAYLFQAPQLWQVTEDHSLAYEYKKAGILNRESVSSSKNVITRSVGYEKGVLVDIVERKLHHNELFLLCSDGLTGNVSDQRISQILTDTPLKEVPSLCVEEAKRGGGEDNISVIIISVEEVEENESRE